MYEVNMETQDKTTTKIAVVGAGNVGTTFAYSLLQSGLASEIVLLDANQSKAEGEAMDLNHAVPFVQPTKIWAGSYADCRGAAITVVTAGSGQKPGETRLDLVHRNVSIFKSIIPEIVKNNPEGLLLIATNPVDVLSYASWKISGLPANRVIGSGTILDTARFRYLISQHAGVDPRSVHAYIIGEHGDSEVPVWSLANIAGMKIKDYCKANCRSYDAKVWKDIYRQTRDAAYQIIQKKGATFYAVANGLLRIVEAVLRDQDTVLSLSSYINGPYGIKDLYISVPCVVGRQGVNHLMNINLDKKELTGLQKSASLLSQVIDDVGLR
jgi:L-lactate dehydrogenase